MLQLRVVAGAPNSLSICPRYPIDLMWRRFTPNTRRSLTPVICTNHSSLRALVLGAKPYIDGLLKGRSQIAQYPGLLAQSRTGSPFLIGEGGWRRRMQLSPQATASGVDQQRTSCVTQVFGRQRFLQRRHSRHRRQPSRVRVRLGEISGVPQRSSLEGKQLKPFWRVKAIMTASINHPSTRARSRAHRAGFSPRIGPP